MQVPEFSAHNILLADGRMTFPAGGAQIEESQRFQSVKRSLERIYPEGLAGKRVLDLGCLEGGYTVGFARLGMDALGIEARQINYDNCEFARRNLDLPNLSFARDDAWNCANYGAFDVVFCCGLLYHLDRPKAFIELLSSINPGALFVNTHVASAEGNDFFPLGDLADHEGMKGRWFYEYENGLNEAGREAIKWSAWSNPSSFWPTQPCLLQAMSDAGYAVVFEQFDWLDNIERAMTTGYYAKQDRRMLVGLK